MPWKVAAEKLANEAQAKEARAELLKVKNLDQELEKALGPKSLDERLALTVITKLPRPSLVPRLLELTRTMDVTEVRTGVYYLTLLSLTDGVRGKAIVDEVATRLDLTEVKVPSSLRIALLGALNQQRRLPSLEVLSAVLDDPSFELRIKVLEVIEKDVSENPERYLALLKKSLSISPFPVRLRALEMIEMLSTDQRKLFRELIQSCSEKDPSEVVKSKCRSLRI